MTRNLENLRKSIYGIEDNHFYYLSKHQEMPARFYPKWETDRNFQKIKTQTNRSGTSENILTTVSKSYSHECNIDSYYSTRKTTKGTVLLF